MTREKLNVLHKQQYKAYKERIADGSIENGLDR